MKTHVRVVAAMAFLTSARLVGAADEPAPAPHEAAVTLHVQNRAQVAWPPLEAGEGVAAAIYRNAGIRVLWMHDERRPGAPQKAPSAPTVDLWVVLLHGSAEQRLIKEAQIGAGPLGCAPGNGADGSNRAYVFFDRVLATANRRQYPLPWLLGQVIAHEIGHLLLPPDSHSDGIMRAELDLIIGPIPLFTPEQAARIRRRIASARNTSELPVER